MSDIKEGDTIICVDPRTNLTKGRRYVAMDDAHLGIDGKSLVVRVRDDAGHIGGYFVYRFVKINVPAEDAAQEYEEIIAMQEKIGAIDS